MNKKTNKIRIVTMMLFMAAIVYCNNTKSSLAESIKITQQNGGLMDYLPAAGNYSKPKYTTPGTQYSAYCLNPNKSTPAGETVTSTSNEYVPASKMNALRFIGANGQVIFKNGSSSSYLTGDARYDYYITQQALNILLGYTNYSKVESYKNSTDSLKRNLATKILNLYNDAVASTGYTLNSNLNEDKDMENYSIEFNDDEEKLNDINVKNEDNYNEDDNAEENKEILEESDNDLIINNNDDDKYKEIESKNISSEKTIKMSNTRSSSISLSKTNLTFYKEGNKFVTDYITVNGDGIDDFSVSTTKPVYGIQVEYKGSNKFRIVVDESNVENKKFTVTISVVVAREGIAATEGFYKVGGLQPILIYKNAGSGGSSGGTQTLKAYARLDNCGPTIIPGNWIQNKYMKFTEVYSLKKGSQNVNTLKINTEYDLNPVVRYVYEAVFNEQSKLSATMSISQSEEYVTNNKSRSNLSSCYIALNDGEEACPEPRLPDPPSAGSYSSTVYYEIEYKDYKGVTREKDRGSVETGVLNIPGNPTSSYVDSFISQVIPVDVPNIKGLIVAEIKLKVDNSELNLSFPIEYEYDNDISIGSIETNIDDCPNAIKTEEISIKANVLSTNIKTENFKTKLQVSINGGSYKDVVDGEKYAYGVSADFPGQVYFKYKIPQEANNIKFKVTVTPNESETPGFSNNNTNESKLIRVLEPNPSDYNTSLPDNRTNYTLSNEVVSYLKVMKRDKTEKKYTNCGGACQSDGNSINANVCPGDHLEYVWTEPYVAFMIKDKTVIDGIEENTKITKIDFRSKYTKEKVTTNEGFINLVDLLDSDMEEYVKAKAGYGIEFNMETKYENNLPQRYNLRINKSNTVTDYNLPWIEHTPIQGSSSVQLIIKDKQTALAPYMNNNTPVMFANPAVDEIAYANVNQMYIQMPNGSYLKAEDKLNYTDGNGHNITENQKASYKFNETIDNQKIKRVKNFELVPVQGKRKYYISENTANSNGYGMVIFTHPIGIRLNCGSISSMGNRFVFDINVYGGYLDDIKTQLNE